MEKDIWEHDIISIPHATSVYQFLAWWIIAMLMFHYSSPWEDGLAFCNQPVLKKKKKKRTGFIWLYFLLGFCLIYGNKVSYWIKMLNPTVWNPCRWQPHQPNCSNYACEAIIIGEGRSWIWYNSVLFHITFL